MRRLRSEQDFIRVDVAVILTVVMLAVLLAVAAWRWRV